jgi:hypothetical protein
LKRFWTSTLIDWLLSGDPFVRYRTLIDLLDRNEKDKEVIATKKLIFKDRLIKRIFAKQNKNGYWGTPQDIYAWFPKKDTTFWLLSMLADFGFAKDNNKIARACEYVFSTQHPSGGFGCGPPYTPYDCFTGILTEALAKLGYVNDPRLKRGYDWIMNRSRRDGGFWCKNTGQTRGPREKEPSCAFATLCVLSALVQNPKLVNSGVAKRAVGFMLTCWDNQGKIKYAGHDSQIGKGWDKLKYPFTDYRILKYVDVLTRFEFGREDPRMKAIIDILISKQDNNGYFYAESIHEAWSDFDFGQKEMPSRWITFLVKRIEKRVMMRTGTGI